MGVEEGVSDGWGEGESGWGGEEGGIEWVGDGLSEGESGLYIDGSGDGWGSGSSSG